MPIKALRRRLKLHNVSSAVKLSVRAHIPFWIKGLLGAAAAALLAVMVWGGYDAGRLFAGFNSSKIEEERNKMSTELIQLRTDNGNLVKRNTELESDTKIAQGAKQALSEQIVGLQTSVTQLKEELAFFQKLTSGAVKDSGVSIQRLQVEPDGANAYKFRALVAQNASQAGEFKGTLQLILSVQQDGKRMNVVLPDEQADTASSLKLGFKTYQRIEGTFRVANGAQVKSAQAKVFAQNNTTPKAQINIQLNN
jgi:hypothetical protein